MTNKLLRVNIEIPYQRSCESDSFLTDAPRELVKKIAEENANIDIKKWCEDHNLESVGFDDVPHMGQEDLIKELESKGYNVYFVDYNYLKVTLDW